MADETKDLWFNAEGDDRLMYMRLGAALLARWSKLPPAVQDNLISEAGNMGDPHTQETGLVQRVRQFVEAKKR